MVVELEGTVIGCAALYPVCEESGEIACIAIHPDYQRAKLGGRLLSELERKAEQQNLTYVYALTTVASHFFLEKGFVEIGVEELPEQKVLVQLPAQFKNSQKAANRLKRNYLSSMQML